MNQHSDVSVKPQIPRSTRFDFKVVFLAIVMIWLNFSSVGSHWNDISLFGKFANVSVMMWTLAKLSIPVQLLVTGQQQALRKTQVEELVIPLLFTAIGSGLNRTLYI